MPILKRSEVDWETDKGGRQVAFLRGTVDECGLKEKGGEIAGYDLRVKIGSGDDMRHIYHRIWLNDQAKFNDYDAPKLADVFGFTGGMRELIAGDCEEWFLGKKIGIRLTPATNNDDRYFTSLFKIKPKAVVNDDARARKLAALGLADSPAQQPAAAAAPVVDDDDSNSIPF